MSAVPRPPPSDLTSPSLRGSIHVPPVLGANLPGADYERVRAEHRWEAVERALVGPQGRGGNIGALATDRHVESGQASDVAIYSRNKRGLWTTTTYAELADDSNRFARLLADLGVAPGDRVFSLLGRVPELFPTILGTLKHRAVFCPLFTAFGPEPILTRMEKGRARVLVTTASLYTKKVASIRSRLRTVTHVLIVDDDQVELPPQTFGFKALMRTAQPTYAVDLTQPETPALLHFTSGTTGTPKGALHGHGAALAHYSSARYALDVRAGDRYWCTADPGWVT